MVPRILYDEEALVQVPDAAVQEEHHARTKENRRHRRRHHRLPHATPWQ